MSHNPNSAETIEIGKGRNFPTQEESETSERFDPMREVTLSVNRALLDVLMWQYYQRLWDVSNRVLFCYTIGGDFLDTKLYSSRSPEICAHDAEEEELAELYKKKDLIDKGLQQLNATPRVNTGQDVVLLGQTCAGKSSLAALLGQKGWVYIPEKFLPRVAGAPQFFPFPNNETELERYRKSLPEDVNDMADDDIVNKGFRLSLYAIARFKEHIVSNILSACISLLDVNIVTPGSLIQQIVGVIASAGLDHFPAEFLPYLFALPRIPDKIVFMNISEGERRRRLEIVAAQDPSERKRREEVLELEESGRLMKVYDSMISQLRQLGYPSEIIVVSDIDGTNEDGETASFGGIEAVPLDYFKDNLDEFLPTKPTKGPMNLWSFEALVTSLLSDEGIEEFHRWQIIRKRLSILATTYRNTIAELGGDTEDLQDADSANTREDLSALSPDQLERKVFHYQQKIRRLGGQLPEIVPEILDEIPGSHHKTPIDLLTVLSFLPGERLQTTFREVGILPRDEVNALILRSAPPEPINSQECDKVSRQAREFLQFQRERAEILLNTIMSSLGE